jgi:hypothetical protein
MSASFREQVRDRQRLTGTFFKTASYQAVEVLAGSGLDFIVLDAEHAPFDRNQLDVCLMAARAGCAGHGRDRPAGAACAFGGRCAARAGGISLSRRSTRLFQLAARRRLWPHADAGACRGQ